MRNFIALASTGTGNWVFWAVGLLNASSVLVGPFHLWCWGSPNKSATVAPFQKGLVETSFSPDQKKKNQASLCTQGPAQLVNHNYH